MEVSIVKLISFAVVTITSFLSVCYGTGQNIQLTLFKNIDVPVAVLLNASTKQEMKPVSFLSCFMLANQRNWSHLVCFNMQDYVCSLYDVSLPANYRAANDDPSSFIGCYTDIHQGCFYNGQLYPEGQVHKQSFIEFTCINMVWVSPQGDLPICPDGFEPVLGVGCIIVVETDMLFEESKQHCQSLGARLAIPDNFENLRQYIKSSDHTKVDYRVGIYKDVWMDGRPVNEDDWFNYPVEPITYAEDCGYMGVGFDYKLHDSPCLVSYLFICQLM